MGQFDRRTGAIAILALIEVLAIVVGAFHELPKHGGWYLAGALVILGAVFGLRAVFLPVVACITLLIAGQTQCTTQEHCAEAFIWLGLAPIVSIPAIGGAVIGWLMRGFASRFTRPS